MASAPNAHATFRIDTLELEAYQARLEFAAGSISKVGRRVTNRYAGLIVKEAKRRVPVRTGDLKRSIRKTGSARDGAGVVAEMPYAGFVEFGTSRMSPRPYLTPAFAKYRTAYVDELAQVAGDMLGRGGKTMLRGQPERFSLEQQLVAGQFTP